MQCDVVNLAPLWLSTGIAGAAGLLWIGGELVIRRIRATPRVSDNTRPSTNRRATKIK